MRYTFWKELRANCARGNNGQKLIQDELQNIVNTKNLSQILLSRRDNLLGILQYEYAISKITGIVTYDP